MKQAHITFKEVRFGEYLYKGPNDGFCTVHVVFDIVAGERRYLNCKTHVKQSGDGPFEIGFPTNEDGSKYDGPMNWAHFANIVEQFFHLVAGPDGRIFKYGGENITLRDFTLNVEGYGPVEGEFDYNN